ncbi:MAG TPA: hypothetical protein VGP89_18390 [Candidatus Angelobacter sp.]|nr:hypothetical protein [Candidatus Angelobacter sp.]
MNTNPRWRRSTAAWLSIFVLAALSQPVAAASKDKPQKEKPYALIFGTAFGPNDRPLYGVKIRIRPQTKKRPTWDLISDHRGEFAQRVPPGPGDYLIRGEAEYAPAGEDGRPQLSKKVRLKGETRVHVGSEERLDISLHLTE